MSKRTKEVLGKKVPMTDVQIRVDSEKRIKAFNEEIAKLYAKYEVNVVPVLDGLPMHIRPVIKIVSTKKYETAEAAEGNQPVKE